MENDFADIVDKYQDSVYNQAFRMLGNSEDAEEAAQDIFMRVYSSLPSFRGECKLSTWIYRITFNVCLNRKDRKKPVFVSIDEENTFSEKEFLGDITKAPDKILSDKELSEAIQEKLRELPPKWAMVLSFYHFEGLSYEEIAEIMEIPKATVATYIFRGRTELAKTLAAFSDREKAGEKR